MIREWVCRCACSCLEEIVVRAEDEYDAELYAAASCGTSAVVCKCVPKEEVGE